MSLPEGVALELIKLLDGWAQAGKDELVHHALDVLGREGDEDLELVIPCPSCGESERLEDTSTAGVLRLTCKRCGMSWNPKEQENGRASSTV